jgi:hypothetical protein
MRSSGRKLQGAMIRRAIKRFETNVGEFLPGKLGYGARIAE